MKKTTAILYLAICATPVMAQVPDKPQSKAPAFNSAAATQAKPTADIREKLIELAMKNPALKAAAAERQKAIGEVKKAGASWLDYVVGSVNFNEISLKQVNTNQYGQLYYPLWNVGVNVPLGSFGKNAQSVKVARSHVDYMTAKQEEMERKIRALIQIKYQDYLTKKEMLGLQSELTEDEYTAFSQAEQKFLTGAITYDVYSASSKSYNNELVKKLTLERDLEVVKLEIEEIIGVKIDDVLAGKY